MKTFADLLDVLGDRDIYSWRTKRVRKTVGLLNLIGSEDARDRRDGRKTGGESGHSREKKQGKPEMADLNLGLFRSIWQTQCRVYGAEIFLDVGKVYLNLRSVLDQHPQITLGFSVWIKIPKNKQKYIEAYNAKKKEEKRKRKREEKGGDMEDWNEPLKKGKEKVLLEIQHDLLKSRSLSDLLSLSRSDGYIQLGDLDLSWTTGTAGAPVDVSDEEDSEESQSTVSQEQRLKVRKTTNPTNGFGF